MTETKYGIQMFCLRDITPHSMEYALKSVAEIGFKYAEFGGLYDYNPRDIKSWLDKYGLACCGTHIGLDELAPDTIEDTIEKYSVLDCKNIIVPWCDGSTPKKAAETIDKLNFAHKVLDKNGICLGYHNHSFEFFPSSCGGILMEDEIINKTSLNLQIDTFWLHNAGIDVVTYLEEHKNRISSIHLKDGIPAPEANRNYEDCTKGVKGLSVGLGNVPAREIVDWANKNNVLIVIESEGMDPSGLEEVGRCMDYLNTI